MTSSVLKAGLFAALIVGTPAVAQSQCREGKTVQGQCADPAVSEAMRQSAVIYSQPKISMTAYPVMPSVDARVRYPNELNPTPLRPSGIGTLAPN